jgi:hypothetical protein
MNHDLIVGVNRHPGLNRKLKVQDSESFQFDFKKLVYRLSGNSNPIAK